MCRCVPPTDPAAGTPAGWAAAAAEAAEATAARRRPALTSWFWAPVSRTQMYLSLSMVTFVKVMAFCCTPRSWSCRGQARRGDKGAAVGSGSSWRAPLLFQARLPRTLPPARPTGLGRRAGRASPRGPAQPQAAAIALQQSTTASPQQGRPVALTLRTSRRPSGGAAIL
jgi:hypothetical protein